MGFFKKDRRNGMSVSEGMAAALANGKRPFEIREEGGFTVQGMGDDLPMLMEAEADDAFIHYLIHLDIQTSGWRMDDLYMELNRLNMRVPFGNFIVDGEAEEMEVLFRYDYPHLNNGDPKAIGDLTDLMFDIVDKHDGDLKKLAEAVPDVPDSMYGRDKPSGLASVKC